MKDKILFYDIEVYPNLFLVIIANKGIRDTLLYQIGLERNDLKEIVNFFKDKKKWFVGYNSQQYDDPIMNFLIENYDRLKDLSELEITEEIQTLSNKIIEEEDRKYRYKDHFQSIDMMRIGLKGNMRKSLKMQAVNLRHGLIQDLPIKVGEHIKKEQLKQLYKYCLNDVIITEKLYNTKDLYQEILLRKDIYRETGLNVMSDPNSLIADRLIEKMYSERVNQHPSQFRNLRTKREKIKFSECISPKIKFKTPKMKEFLKKLKRVELVVDSDKWEDYINIGETQYKIALGGLHSEEVEERIPNARGKLVKRKVGKIWTPDKDHVIVDADVSSFYPFIIINNKLKPEHLDDCFLELYKEIAEERIKAKGRKDKKSQVKAASYKIIVNATYGKLKDINSWFYDPKILYSVTLTGQLSLLMLIEALEEAGIRVFYANTDGVTAKVPKDKLEIYNKICESWSRYTGFSLDLERFKKCVIADVNNYIMVYENGKVKAKGRFDRDAWKDFNNKKQYHMPIVAHALHEYFVNGVPVEEEVGRCKDIHMFCMTAKVGPTYNHVEFQQIVNFQYETKEVQRVNRYYVTSSLRGGNLFKVKKGENSQRREGICAEQLVYLYNDADNDKNPPEPLRSWYVKQILEEIAKFQTQQTLFQ